jgi:hypothetical protein
MLIDVLIFVPLKTKFYLNMLLSFVGVLCCTRRNPSSLRPWNLFVNYLVQVRSTADFRGRILLIVIPRPTHSFESIPWRKIPTLFSLWLKVFWSYGLMFRLCVFVTIRSHQSIAHWSWSAGCWYWTTWCITSRLKTLFRIFLLFCLVVIEALMYIWQVLILLLFSTIYLILILTINSFCFRMLGVSISPYIIVMSIL